MDQICSHLNEQTHEHFQELAEEPNKNQFIE